MATKPQTSLLPAILTVPSNHGKFTTVLIPALVKPLQSYFRTIRQWNA